MNSQVSKHKLKEGEEINFHRNQFIVNNTFQRITQESWLILSGKAQLITYDIDNSFLQCIGCTQIVRLPMLVDMVIL